VAVEPVKRSGADPIDEASRLMEEAATYPIVPVLEFLEGRASEDEFVGALTARGFTREQVDTLISAVRTPPTLKP